MKGAEDRQFEKFRLTGSPRALGRVYDLVAPELLDVALHLAGDVVDAEDLVQRTFVTAIEKARNFKDGERVLPWLLGILAYHAKNEKRRRARPIDPSRLQEPSAEPPTGKAEALELNEHIEKALSSLPDEQRSVLTLRLKHNLSAAQIADALGRPTGTVRSQMARGLEKLRSTLPAGLVASATIAFGLPRGLQAIRATLLRDATTWNVSKLAIAKGYCTWALMPVLETVLMKKLALAAVLVLGALAAIQHTPSGAVTATTEPLGPEDSGHVLPVASRVEVPSTAEQGSQRRASITNAPTCDLHDVEPDVPVLFGAVQVRVQDSSREPVRGEVCILTFSGQAAAGMAPLTARTNDKGIARFEEVPCGSTSVRPLRASRNVGGQAFVRNGATIPVVLTLPVGIEVQGQVVNERREPVPGAEVWMPALSLPQETFAIATADAEGRFKLRAVGKNRLIGAMAPGYGISYSQEVEGEPGETSSMTIVLDTPGGQLNLDVVDAEGQPIEGARAIAGEETPSAFRDLGAGRTGFPAPPRHGRTDENGQLTLSSITAGDVEVQVRAPGFAPTETRVNIFENGTSHVRLTLLPETQLRGRVLSSAGDPVQGATVWLGTAYRFASSRCRTDEDGQFHLYGLGDGSRWIQARADKLGSVRQEVLLVTGKLHTLDLVIPQHASIHGTLVNAQGEELARHTLIARESSNASLPGSVFVCSTQADGSFSLLVEEDETYTVTVRPPGNGVGFPVLIETGLRASVDPLQLRVPHSSTEHAGLRIEVLDSQGSPCQQVSLRMRMKKPSEYGIYELRDPSGEYEVQALPTGSMAVTLLHPNYPSLELGEFVFKAGEVLDLGVQRFAPSCSLQGTLVGITDPTLLSGIELRISQADGSRGFLDRAETKFTSGPLAPGTHQLTVMGKFVVPVYRAVELAEGETSSLEVELVRCGLRKVEFWPEEGAQSPQWIGVQVFNTAGQVVWSAGADRQPNGSFVANVSALPGHYRLEAKNSLGGQTSRQFDITGLHGAQPALELHY